MKKIIVLMIVFSIVFPAYSLDLIHMKNGDLYLGTILSMDVSSAVVIQMQSGVIEELQFKEISTINKIENESASPNIVIQTTNTNENIIGSSVIKSLPEGRNELMQFVASTKKSPTKVLFQGVEYPISNVEELQRFYSVVSVRYPDLHRDIRLMFDTLIKSKNEQFQRARKNQLWMLGGALMGTVSLGAGIGLATKEKPSDFEMDFGTGLFVGGTILTVSLLLGYIFDKSYSLYIAFDEPIKNIVGRFNFLYAN